MPLRSYVQPLIIMSAIPFGLIGAVWAHVSMMSMFGLVALTGVVVNDSLIMVDFINRARATHTDVGRMAQQAGSGPADRRLFETAGLALAVREAGVHLPADPAHVAQPPSSGRAPSRRARGSRPDGAELHGRRSCSGDTRGRRFRASR